MIAEAAELAASLTTVPAFPQLIADDVTPEKLVSLLRDQDGRIALMSSEGGVFGIMAGRYGREGGPNLDVYLKGHAGDTLRVDRMNREPDYVQRPALTLALTVQPDVIRSLADQPGFRGRGLLGRFLYSLPESRVGTRKYRGIPIDPRARAAYDRLILRLLDLAADVEEDYSIPIRLEDDALALWAGYADGVEALQAEGGALSTVRDWASKLSGAVARIAGVLHLCGHAGKDEPDEPEAWSAAISGDTVLAAWSIGEYLQAHALAAFGLMGADPVLAQARRVLRWIERSGRQRLTLRECHKNFPSAGRPEDLLPALEILEGRGYLRRLPDPARYGPGRRPSPEFAVNPLSAESAESAELAAWIGGER
jgi:hypothetical protein